MDPPAAIDVDHTQEPVDSVEPVDAVAPAASPFNWRNHVRDLTLIGSNYTFQCRFCDRSIKGGRARFIEHLVPSTASRGRQIRGCLHCPKEVRQAVVNQQQQQKRSKNIQRAAESLQATSRGSLPPTKRLRREGSDMEASTSLPSTARQTEMPEMLTKQELKEAQLQVSKMWYGEALAFNSVYNPWVVDAFDAVCAYGAATGHTTFPLPSKRALRNANLESVVADIEERLAVYEASLDEFGCSLQSDGKDSMGKTHLVNIVTSNPHGSRFHKTVDVSGQSRDAAHTAQLLVDAAKELEDAGRHVVTIVTDTPAVNRAAWKICESQLPHTSCLPCAAHVLNLHLKHCSSKITHLEELVSAAKVVVKRFSNVDFARTMVRQNIAKFTTDDKHPKGRQLEVYKPGDTRFASNIRMMERLQELRRCLVYIVSTDEYHNRCVARNEKEDPASDIIMERKFWKDVDDYVKLFWPAYLALREFDTNKPSVCSVWETGIELQQHYATSTSPYAKVCQEMWASVVARLNYKKPHY